MVQMQVHCFVLGASWGSRIHQVCILSRYAPLHVSDIQSPRGGVAIRRPLNGLGIAPNIRTVVVTPLSGCTPRPSPYEADLEGTGRTPLKGALHHIQWLYHLSIEANSHLFFLLMYTYWYYYRI